MITSSSRSAVTVLSVLGAGLLFATGGIHLDLYLTGYRSIPTIGPLFILQVISAFALALSVLAVRSYLVSISGALFGLSTLGGYLLSRGVGLFGFNEVRTTAGIVSGLIEVAIFAVLGVLTLQYLSVDGNVGTKIPTMLQTRSQRDVSMRRGAVVVLSIAAIGVMFGVDYGVSNGTAGAPTTASAAGSGAHGAIGLKVLIKNFAFVPASFTVKPGETVMVTNDDSVAHTLTATPGSTPLGGFDTGNINPGKSATFTAPMKPGAYHYDCTIHNFMVGVLTVAS